MSKKLIITESQYIKLINMLIEATGPSLSKIGQTIHGPNQFSEMIKNIQPNDIVSINWGGKVNNFKVIGNDNEDVTMDFVGKDQNYINNRYLMNPYALEGTDLELRYVDKVNQQDILDDTEKWGQITLNNVSDISDIRGGKLVAKIKTTEPEPQSQEEPNDEEPGMEDDNDQVDDAEHNSEDAENEDVSNVDVEKLYNSILADKNMQKIFYRQQGFWDTFIAELTGKAPKSKGLITIMDTMDKIINKKLIDKIGEGFSTKGKVSYEVGTETEIRYRKPSIKTPEGKYAKGEEVDNPFILKPNIDYSSYIRRFQFEDTNKVLMKDISNEVGLEDYKLRILVKEKTDEPNIKNCDIEIVHERFENKFEVVGKIKDRKIKFKDSDGYKEQSKSQPNQSTPSWHGN